MIKESKTKRQRVDPKFHICQPDKWNWSRGEDSPTSREISAKLKLPQGEEWLRQF